VVVEDGDRPGNLVKDQRLVVGNILEQGKPDQVAVPLAADQQAAAGTAGAGGPER